MELPSPDTPLYNHTLPNIEEWLAYLGCHQDSDEVHCWHIEKATWKAKICLETEELMVCYLQAAPEGENINRSFKYSLSRQDVESAVFDGP